MGVHDPNSRGHTKGRDSITPTRGATPKHGSPSPQVEGPHRSLGVHFPSSTGHSICGLFCLVGGLGGGKSRHRWGMVKKKNCPRRVPSVLMLPPCCAFSQRHKRMAQHHHQLCRDVPFMPAPPPRPHGQFAHNVQWSPRGAYTRTQTGPFHYNSIVTRGKSFFGAMDF